MLDNNRDLIFGRDDVIVLELIWDVEMNADIIGERVVMVISVLAMCKRCLLS